MLKITLHILGGAGDRDLEAAEKEYLKRLKGKAHLEIKEHLVKSGSSSSPKVIMEIEAKALLGRLNNADFLIALDRTAKQIASERFAQKIEQIVTQGASHIHFVVGGPYGLDQRVLDRANFKVSLSDLTFTTAISRFLIVEQIYRAISIINHLPYHK